MITKTDLFEVTYDRVFRGQPVDTKRAGDCERIWDAAWQAAYPQARADLIAEFKDSVQNMPRPMAGVYASKIDAFKDGFEGGRASALAVISKE